MATESFNKSFQISKQETINRLEESMNNRVPLSTNIEKHLNNRKMNEDRLLKVLRSKNNRRSN